MSFDDSVGIIETLADPRQGDGPLRVAVIDRDSGFLRVLTHRVAAHGWELRTLPSQATPERLVGMRLNALVLDVELLGPDTWNYLERVCSRLPTLAVIVCTGPSSVAQRVRGLRLGVDAWVTKPFHAEELIAVVQAAVRRHRRGDLPSLEETIEVGEVTIRPDRHQAYVNDSSLELTAREFEILHLVCHAPRVLRREEIYESLWGYAMARGDRSVDVFVGKLRQKLRAGSPRWSYIHTHFGVGYRFAAELEESADSVHESADAGHESADAGHESADPVHDAARDVPEAVAPEAPAKRDLALTRAR